jgi:peroxiredoxin
VSTPHGFQQHAARVDAERILSLCAGDQFPVAALSAFGVKGKPTCIFFFGADDAPSCSKELSAFDESLEEFAALGVSVVGVRNEAGVKLVYDDLRLVVDEGDEIRNAIGIAKDFGFLGGRETYLVDKSGTVVNVRATASEPCLAHASRRACTSLYTAVRGCGIRMTWSMACRRLCARARCTTTSSIHAHT